MKGVMDIRKRMKDEEVGWKVGVLCLHKQDFEKD